MKILLLHPLDSPWNDLWRQKKWDMVVDLGWAGDEAYLLWEQTYKCKVLSIWTEVDKTTFYQQVNDIQDTMRNQLVDTYGIDWLDIILPSIRKQIFDIILSRAMISCLPRNTTIFVSRKHDLADYISEGLGQSVIVLYQDQKISRAEKLLEYVRNAFQFSSKQLCEILVNKFDALYQKRRLLKLQLKKIDGRMPLVLVPSSYVNVSRNASKFAASMSDYEFLIVTLQPNAKLFDERDNIRTTSIASYVPSVRAIQTELKQLLEQWGCVRQSLIKTNAEFELLDRIGAFNTLPAFLRRGLILKEAWKKSFETLRPNSVFCGDENNFDMRLSVLIAKSLGIRTVSFHHGALDCSMYLKPLSSSFYLTRSLMEYDYLSKSDMLFTRALIKPNIREISPLNRGMLDRSNENLIIFFSEPYECGEGRVDEIYRSILKPLLKIAHSEHRRIIVKLHPFESLKQRIKVIHNIVKQEDLSMIQVIEGPLDSKLLEQVWFVITLKSSVVIDCAEKNIPCFMCKWLDYFCNGYIDQFAKFGAGYVLNKQKDINDIPMFLLRDSQKKSTSLEHNFSAPDISKLKRLLSGQKMLKNASGVLK